MKVLALTHVFPRSPEDVSAPFLLTWARALQAVGADVTVLAPHDAGLPREHEVDGVHVRRVRYAPERAEVLAYRGEMHLLARTPEGLALAGGLVGALAAALRSEAARRRPDVVHVHWWLPGAVAARLARPRAPVVVTVHGTDVALCEQRPLLAGLARRALSVADRIEAVSTDLARRLSDAVGRAADAVNPMPLAPQWLDAPPPAPPARPPGTAAVVLAVGRLVPEKGFADLVAAVARLRRPVRLVVVGDGPERGALAALARSLDVVLELPGRLERHALRGAYAGADVVAQPSHREGFGLVAAEAAVLGVPVVATDSGGVRDVLPADRLVPVGDVDALAAALDGVVADPLRARTAAAAVAARVREHLSPAAAAGRTLAGYAGLTRRG